MSEVDEGTIHAVESLARRTLEAESTDYDSHAIEGLIVRPTRDDTHLEKVDLESYLEAPRRIRGAASVSDVESFVAYVARLRTAATTVWADEDGSYIEAVFNDHENDGSPGWRDHSVRWTVKADTDWRTWFSKDGVWFSQEDFAEFIEDNYPFIVAPSAAEMLEVASSFRARKNSQFERVVHSKSGDVQLRFHEQTTATAGQKGELEVPDRFTVRLTPCAGVDPVDVICRFRFRIGREGVLTVGFKMVRPKDIVKAAFQGLVQKVRDGLGDETLVLSGVAPDSLE